MKNYISKFKNRQSIKKIQNNIFHEITLKFLSMNRQKSVNFDEEGETALF